MRRRLVAVVLVSIRHDCTEAPKTCDIIGSVGWLKSRSRLKTLLETGHVMPWPENPSSPLKKSYSAAIFL